jgi:hypothetical protein
MDGVGFGLAVAQPAVVGNPQRVAPRVKLTEFYDIAERTIHEETGVGMGKRRE